MQPRHRLIRFAHRGASALAPENTLAAFQEAADLGCDWIETDVRLTSDLVPILIHDDTVDRTTDGRGAVGEMEIHSIRSLDAGSWFARRFRGERIPTLDEALEWGRGRCGLNLEIKEELRREEAIRRIVRSVVAQAAVERVIFSSFRAQDLLRVRTALPRARLGWLVSRNSRGLKPLHREARLFALHPKDPLVTSRLVRRCDRMDLAVHVWVVNRQERLAELEALGVRGVMTDDPRLFSM